MAYIDTGAYNKWRRQQEQQNAMDDYARQREEIDNKYQERPTGLAGLLSNLTRDIKSTGNTLFTTVSALASPFMQKYTDAANKAAQAKGNEELDKIAQKYGYKDRAEAMDRGDGPDDMWNEMKDISNKTSETVKNISENFKNNAAVKKVNETKQSQYGADAIRTLRNAANVMGVGLTPVGGAIGGAAEGFADALESADGTLTGPTRDTSLDWGQAAKNAGVGALTGAVTAGVGNKIGNATSGIGSKLLNNRVATSAIGRGAIGGAVGGAVGGGLGAGLEGGDVLGGALQGAGSGALTGGVAGGLTSGARKIGTAVTDRIGVTDRVANARQKLMYTPEEKTPIAQVEEQKPYNVMAEEAEIEGLPDYTRPIDYNGDTLSIKKKNIVQKFGDNLQDVGDSIANRDLYNSLYSKTANRIAKNKAIERLSELGFTPDDYAEAAKISTTTNKFVDDIVKNSGAKIVDNDLVTRLKTLPDDVIISNPSYQKKYNNIVNNVMTRLEKGKFPGEYSAADLLKLSREVGETANTYRKNASDVNGGMKTGDDAQMADALTRAKYELRDLASTAVDGFGDNYTKSQLAKRLNNLGVKDQKVIDYITNADDIGGFIRNTGLFEDARQMAFEMDTNKIRRNAVSGNNSNKSFVKQTMDDAGASQLMGLVTKPIGKGVGKLAKRAGKAISAVGGGEKANTAKTNPTPTTQISPDLQNVYNLLGLEIGMNEARSNASDSARNREFQNLEDQLSSTMAGIDAEYGPSTGLDGGYGMAQQNAANSQLIAQMETISGAMNNALAAGDMKAYSQLADLYKDAYDIYKIQNPTSNASNTKLTEKQQVANAAAYSLDQLEQMDPDFGYRVKDIPLLNLVNFQGNEYDSTATSLAQTIGYMMSGATVTPAEAEAAGRAYVPQPWDSEEKRKYKLNLARNIIKRYQNNTLGDAA